MGAWTKLPTLRSAAHCCSTGQREPALGTGGGATAPFPCTTSGRAHTTGQPSSQTTGQTCWSAGRCMAGRSCCWHLPWLLRSARLCHPSPRAPSSYRPQALHLPHANICTSRQAALCKARPAGASPVAPPHACILDKSVCAGGSTPRQLRTQLNTPQDQNTWQGTADTACLAGRQLRRAPSHHS